MHRDVVVVATIMCIKKAKRLQLTKLLIRALLQKQ